MIIRPAPTSDDEPDVTLTDSAAFEVLLPAIGNPTIHFVGCIERTGVCRVSSNLRVFDARNRFGVTASGRVYRLSGLHGLRSEAAAVWAMWQCVWDGTVLRDLSCTTMDRLISSLH